MGLFYGPAVEMKKPNPGGPGCRAPGAKLGVGNSNSGILIIPEFWFFFGPIPDFPIKCGAERREIFRVWRERSERENFYV